MQVKITPETAEQICLFDWIRTQPHIEPYAMHIANERRCSIQQGKILKRMGVKAGVADIFVAIPRGIYHGLWIELKAGKNKATPLQKEFLANMAKQGYLTACVTGYENAREIIENYINQ